MEKLVIALFFFALCLYFAGIPFPYLEIIIAVLSLVRGLMALR
jgi:hypothetical protein